MAFIRSDSQSLRKDCEKRKKFLCHEIKGHNLINGLKTKTSGQSASGTSKNTVIYLLSLMSLLKYGKLLRTGLHPSLND